MRKVYFMRLFESICKVGNYFFIFQSVILKYLFFIRFWIKNNIEILPFHNTNIIFDLDEYPFHLKIFDRLCLQFVNFIIFLP